MTINYIEQITKYLTDHNREDEIPFVLLSAKVQAMEQGHYLCWLAEPNAPYKTMDELNIDQLLIWNNTKEGHNYWMRIQAHTDTSEMNWVEI